MSYGISVHKINRLEIQTTAIQVQQAYLNLQEEDATMKKNGPVTIMTLMYFTFIAIVMLAILTLAAEEKITQMSAVHQVVPKYPPLINRGKRPRCSIKQKRC